MDARFELCFESIDLDKSTEERGLGLARLGPLTYFSYTTVADTPPLVSKEMRIGLWLSPLAFRLIHPANLELTPVGSEQVGIGLSISPVWFPLYYLDVRPSGQKNQIWACLKPARPFQFLTTISSSHLPNQIHFFCYF